MKAIDIGAYFLIYDFIIGVLVMLSSEKLGGYAGCLNKSHRKTIARLTQVSAFAFGACVAVLCSGIYIVFYTLRLGI
jgi:hypothetical protein